MPAGTRSRSPLTIAALLPFVVAACGPAVLFAAGGDGSTATLEMPFEFERNQILLAVTMNGKGPYRMLLDTGGNPSAVDLGAAREAGIPLDTSVAGEAEGVGGRPIPIYAATITDLGLADAAVGDVRAVALDLGHVAARLGKPLHGVLGYSFLQDRIVQIDYRNLTLRIFEDEPPGPREALRRATYPLRLRPGGTIPLLDDVYVNGRRIRATLDTGSSLALELYPWAVEGLGLERLREEAIVSSVVGARGEEDVREVRVESVRIGEVDLRDQPVTFVEKDSDDPEREAGNLGNALLARFLLTLDYRNGEIHLESCPP